LIAQPLLVKIVHLAQHDRLQTVRLLCGQMSFSAFVQDLKMLFNVFSESFLGGGLSECSVLFDIIKEGSCEKE